MSSSQKLVEKVAEVRALVEKLADQRATLTRLRGEYQAAQLTSIKREIESSKTLGQQKVYRRRQLIVKKVKTQLLRERIERRLKEAIGQGRE